MSLTGYVGDLVGDLVGYLVGYPVGLDRKNPETVWFGWPKGNIEDNLLNPTPILPQLVSLVGYVGLLVEAGEARKTVGCGKQP